MSETLSISEDLQKVLNKFERIELTDLRDGAQMERIDRKYPVHISRIPEVLRGLESEYKIVRAAGSVVSPYDTWYMDTPELKFYRIHHDGFLNRDKVRYRAYPRTRTTFLEVKRKNNKGRTSKARILCNSMVYPFSPDKLKFLEENMQGFDPQVLRPSIFIKYDRIAFINPNGKERFSIDFNISAQIDDKTTNFGEAVILEVMQDRRHTSPIISRLRELRLREASMSKYCLTMSLLNKDLKSNLFKRDLRKLEKIMNEKDE